MDLSLFLIDADALSGDAPCEGRPLTVVDLDRIGEIPGDMRLADHPLIGVGNPAHPSAARLDMLVEAPARLASLVAHVEAHPLAAAIAVQTLRLIEGRSLEEALRIESLAYATLQCGTDHAAWLAGRQPAPVMEEGAVMLERTDDRLDVTMDRPGARNAVDRAMRDALAEAFYIAAIDPDVRHVRLMGAGRSFSMGADLSEFGTTRDPAKAHRIRMATLPAHRIARVADRMTAVVQGACVGAGLEMAAFARRVVASPDAWFQLPELAMGLIPGAGGCVSVSRRIGRQRAALMILSGKRVDARTALSWGLVDAIVDNAAADDGGADIVGRQA